MRHINLLWILFGFVLFVPANALRADEAQAAAGAIEVVDPKLGRAVDFERDVYPILDAKCVACHNVAISENGLNLEDVKNILKGGKRGPAVVAKDPDKSPLFTLATRGAQPAMPPLPNKVEAAPLTGKELGILKQWILEGATAGMGTGGNAVNWQPIPKSVRPIYGAALTHDGQYAAAGRANRVVIYHVPSGEEVAQLTDPALRELQYNGQPMYGPGTSHRDFVHALAFHPSGNMLASSSYREVKLWSRPENVQRLNLAGSAGPVPAIAVSADDKWLAVASAENSIKLFQFASGQPDKVLSGHTGSVSGLVFSADGTKVVSCSHDKTLRVWNFADGTVAAQLELPAPLNAIVLVPDGTKAVVACADNKLRVVALPVGAAPTIEREMNGHGGPVTSVAVVLPEGTRVLSGSDDGTARLWEVSNGTQVVSLNLGGPITSVAVSPDGQRFAAAGANQIARLWNAKDYQQIADLKGDMRANRLVAKLTADEAEAKAAVNTAMNAIPAAEKVLGEKTEAQKKAAEAKAASEKAAGEAAEKVTAAQAALDAAKKAAEEKKDDAALQKAAADADKALKDTQAAAKKADDDKTAAIKALEQADKAVQESTTAVAKAKTDHENSVNRHKGIEANLATAKIQATEKEKPFRSISFSRNGKRLAVAGDSGTVSTFDGATGAPQGVLEGHTGPVLALAFGPGASLVSTSADQSTRVWDLNPAWALAAVLGPKAEAAQDLNDSVFISRVLCLDFNPEGTLLATGGGDPSRSGELILWDVANRTPAKNLENAHSDTVFGVEFSHDGQYIASCAADKFVKVHEVATGKLVKSFEGHTNHVLDVTWRHGDKQLASAGADNAIKIWNFETGEQQRTIGGYNKQVTAIQFIGRGPNLISCGGDKTVRFHQADNGNNFRNFGGATDFMFTASASDDEKIVIAAGQDGTLRVWNGANAQVVKAFEPPQE